MDDIVVTTMMNMIEGRKLKIMPPVNKMSLGKITFIRPMSYVREKELVNLVKQKEIPFSPCNCPV
jgi:tRNA(Ile)-lysidine synthase TilS/MesJ|tara:strand:+ start:645 stop:839 length:195 start_codon:yes stop_codon:yes gene_type:complete